MNDTKKLEKLLQMIEHPEDFTEQQKDEILADSECMDYYNQLVEVRRAFALETVSGEMPDVTEEWKRFKRANIPQKHTAWRTAVAIVIALVVVSGLTFAVIRSNLLGGNCNFDNHAAHKGNPAAHHQGHPDNITPGKRDTTIVPRQYAYDNVALQKIIEDIAQVYHVGVNYKHPAAGNMRFHIRWHSENSLEEVINLLNHFENVHLMLVKDTIVVK